MSWYTPSYNPQSYFTAGYPQSYGGNAYGQAGYSSYGGYPSYGQSGYGQQGGYGSYGQGGYSNPYSSYYSQQSYQPPSYPPTGYDDPSSMAPPPSSAPSEPSAPSQPPLDLESLFGPKPEPEPPKKKGGLLKKCFIGLATILGVWKVIDFFKGNKGKVNAAVAEGYHSDNGDIYEVKTENGGPWNNESIEPFKKPDGNGFRLFIDGNGEFVNANEVHTSEGEGDASVDEGADSKKPAEDSGESK